MVEQSASPAAAYHMARQLEALDRHEEALEFYALSVGCWGEWSCGGSGSEAEVGVMLRGGEDLIVSEKSRDGVEGEDFNCCC